MILLVIFAFLAGVVTVLSPCILPLLPIILSSSDGSGKQKPLGVILGFVGSFTFFTLFLSSLVRWSGVPADSVRFLSIIILGFFGATLLIPRIQTQIEIWFSRLANFLPTGQERAGFLGGVTIGFSLGLLWTPCVGPILASVISLAITGTVTLETFLITFAYSLGTAIPLFFIMLAGSTALQKVPWLVRNTAKIQQVFGVIMILTAVGIFFQLDRRFQTYILQTFPNYGVGLTRLEDNSVIQQQLNNLNEKPMNEGDRGKTLDHFLPKGLPAPELIPGGEWFNSEPLSMENLRGKVVLIDFWTYTCINCQRTLPYLKSWWEKYQESGLVIIGVHSPEFEFEKNPRNVADALNYFSLTYPVVQDNEFATWKAYKNRNWPAKYLVDRNGDVRYIHIGEGAYDETEKAIQDLLKESGSDVSSQVIKNPLYTILSRTPEMYLGYQRIEYFSSPEGVRPEQKKGYTSPEKLPRNSFAFEGEWTIMSEYSAPEKNAQLRLHFEAKNVFLVARTKNGEVGKIRVRLTDGTQAPGADNQEGVVTVDTDRLYELIKLTEPQPSVLEIEFLDDNIEVYAFTFG